MGLKFSCPDCGELTKSFNRGLGEMTHCNLCGKEVKIPTDPQLSEHIPDHTTGTTHSESERLVLAKRGPWVSIMLWSLAIINPLFGSMTIITYFVRPLSVSIPILVVGMLLIVSLVFVIALMRRLRWGVGGYVTVFGMMIVVSLFEMNWEMFLQLLFHMFFFLLIVKSEWDYLR